MSRFLAGAATGTLFVLVATAVIAPPGAPPPETASAAPAPAAAPPQEPAPELTPVRLRAMIHAGDVAGVEAALTGLSTTGKDAQSRVRSIYAMFGERHPKTIAFTEEWLRQSPASPLAMTARGWALESEGGALRGGGTARETSPPAMAALQERHAAGLALMQAALAADPAFLPASDGVIAMSFTTGQQALIEPEVARIMALRPNRWTLTLAGQGLAPNWGGSERQMQELCRAYAPLVTDWPGYDAEVCLVDGQVKAGYLRGAEAEALAENIRHSDNPALAGWNEHNGTVPGDSPSDRLAYLDKVKQDRELSLAEARLYDQDAGQTAILAGDTRQPEFPAALAREVEMARGRAEANPGSWDVVARFLNIAAEDRQVNGTKADMDELWRRQIGALRLLPYEPRAWSSVGMTIFGREAANDEIAAMAEAEPYFINAVVYSNHQSRRLTELASPKLAVMLRAMMAGALPVDKERWQSVVQCPLVRQLRLLMAVCEAEGMGFGDCTGLPYEADNMLGLIRDIQAAGSCKAEATAALQDLAYAPVEVVLPQD